MADLKKFEEMLDRLVNEDREGAEELFHEIVVEKSREIYESLLESEIEDDEDDVEEAAEEEVDESDEDLDESADEDDDEDEEMDEGFDLDEFEVEADPMMGGDPADDMIGAMDDEGDEMDMDDESSDDMEDRVVDLEDALEELKAEFEKMMAGDDDDMDDMDDEDEEEPEEESFAFESDDEEVDEAADEEVDEASDDEVEESKTAKSASEQMREYVEKVSGGGLDAAKIGGDNGANTKSAVAGKNDMGGTTANIAKGGTEAGVEANKGNLKGSALSNQNPKDMNTKNVNVPGAKGATKMNSTKGHGAEKKGAGETAANKKPTIGG